jgi:hypothetical protein
MIVALVNHNGKEVFNWKWIKLIKFISDVLKSGNGEWYIKRSGLTITIEEL